MLNLPKIKIIGDNFLTSNTELTELILKSLTILGDCAVIYNHKIKIIDLEKLQIMGYTFHNNDNQELMNVNIPYIQNHIKNELIKLVENNKSRQLKSILNIKNTKILKRCLS